MFVDQIKIFAQAGNGGDGCVSFRREKFVPKGGPDGGDGGRGGSIIVRADAHANSLTPFFYEPMVKAKNGEHGRGKQCYGRSGADRVLKVPIGTLIYRLPEGMNPFAPKKKASEPDDAGVEVIMVGGRRSSAETDVEADEAEAFEEEGAFEPLEGDFPAGDVERLSEEELFDAEEEITADGEEEATGEEGATVGGAAAQKINPRDLELVADLSHEGAEIVLCKGGIGGKGNVHFKSARNQVPRQSTPGEEGEQGYFFLELRSIADAGLVGYPNAGKSTLLNKISSAHPKVAAYPFTTLHPHIGMVDLGGYRRAPVADIPGLIEGAHQNIGLGHEFLRHIMRCKVLLFVIDMAGSEGRSPIDDLSTLRKELRLYDPLLAERPWFVAANKMDDPNAEENLRHFRQRFPKLDIVPISAELGEGVGDLKARLAQYLFEKEDDIGGTDATR